DVVAVGAREADTVDDTRKDAPGRTHHAAGLLLRDERSPHHAIRSASADERRWHRPAENPHVVAIASRAAGRRRTHHMVRAAGRTGGLLFGNPRGPRIDQRFP